MSTLPHPTLRDYRRDLNVRKPEIACVPRLAPPVAGRTEGSGCRGRGNWQMGRATDSPEARLVRFENVGLRYGPGPEVLKDLSFGIEPNSFQFLTGASGAGKTSLLRLLFLSLRPSRGLITLFDRDASRLALDEIAYSPPIALIPGFPLSITDNYENVGCP